MYGPRPFVEDDIRKKFEFKLKNMSDYGLSSAFASASCTKRWQKKEWKMFAFESNE